MTGRALRLARIRLGYRPELGLKQAIEAVCEEAEKAVRCR